MSEQDVRWKQRFENLDKAFKRLLHVKEAFLKMEDEEVLRIALIGAFNFTFELSWKTLKDLLNHEGVQVALPREVIKQAFHFGLIKDGEVWIKMLEDRNLMSHAYEESAAIEACHSILNIYLPAFRQVYDDLSDRLKK